MPAQIYIQILRLREFLLDPNPRTFLPESERVASDGVLGVIWRGWSWGADNKGVDLCRWMSVGFPEGRLGKSKIKPSQSVEIWRKPNDQIDRRKATKQTWSFGHLRILFLPCPINIIRRGN